MTMPAISLLPLLYIGLKINPIARLTHRTYEYICMYSVFMCDQATEVKRGRSGLSA